MSLEQRQRQGQIGGGGARAAELLQAAGEGLAAARLLHRRAEAGELPLSLIDARGLLGAASLLQAQAGADLQRHQQHIGRDKAAEAAQGHGE
ncbi:MAG: hypothetical protein FJ083_17640 [Cyanobacteria bacterium K_Offshore_surface_m2_239]|nr:hypothetical protein [Cyanobacteria bacterium K_Offshore_surface_m2_239]